MKNKIVSKKYYETNKIKFWKKFNFLNIYIILKIFLIEKLTNLKTIKIFSNKNNKLLIVLYFFFKFRKSLHNIFFKSF